MGIVQIRLLIDAWDCFLYSGLLFIINTNNVLRVYDWPKVILKITNYENELALKCAMLRSDFVYNDMWVNEFNSLTFFERLRTSVKIASSGEFQLTEAEINHALIMECQNPVDDLSTAFSVYKNAMYLSHDGGVHELRFHGFKDELELHTAEKIWDGHVVSLVGGANSALAFGAGSDGTHRYRTIDNKMPFKDAGKVSLLSPHHTTAVDWTGVGLFRSSVLSPGELLTAAPPAPRIKQIGATTRSIERQLTAMSFEFEQVDYSWGVRNRIFTLVDGTLKVYSYQYQHLLDEAALKQDLKPASVLKLEKNIRLDHWKGGVVSAGASSFGVIIECKNALVVLGASGESTKTIIESVARWRVYNRSKFYQNQLHIINEADILLMGFTDDFFVKYYKDRIVAVSRVKDYN